MSVLKVALHEQRDQLIAYLKSKVMAEDWHAVQDAASDLREIDAKLSVLPREGLEAGACLEGNPGTSRLLPYQLNPRVQGDLQAEMKMAQLQSGAGGPRSAQQLSIPAQKE